MNPFLSDSKQEIKENNDGYKLDVIFFENSQKYYVVR